MTTIPVDEHDQVAVSVEGLTRRYGRITAVDEVSFEVRRGAVTGFLGPNGAGKTTMLAMIAGLVRPTSGRVLVGGVPLRTRRPDARTIGVAIEACGAHPGRSAREHLRVLARFARLPRSRVDEVLTLTGIGEVAGRRVGAFSLGMRQRLGLAAALLGDPEVLLLDEPVNGLDPGGIRWLRDLLRARADQGRSVVISSHLLGEVAQTVDDVVIVTQGRLVYAGPVADLARRAGAETSARSRTALEDAFLELTEGAS